MKSVLRVVLRNGDVREYKENQFTDYQWVDGKAFVVIKGKQWIGISNWEEVREVLYLDDEPEE